MLLIIYRNHGSNASVSKIVAHANNLTHQEPVYFNTRNENIAFYSTGPIEKLSSKFGSFNGYATLNQVDNSADPDTNFLQKCLESWRSGGLGFLEKLNGSFNLTLYDAASKKLLISTDRFNTYPLWLAKTDTDILMVSESYHLLVPFVSKELDHAALWSFMAYKRAVANRSLLKQITALREHTALCFGEGSSHSETSWISPKFDPRNNVSLNEWAAIFNENIDSVIESQLRYFKQPALLLSGGIDSRIIAASSPKNTICVTVADFFNTEMKMAAKCAKTCGLKHVPIIREEFWYPNIIKRAAYQCFGLWRWVDSHFLPLGPYIENVDCIFSGLWFDTLMKGYESRELYLKNHAKILAPEKRLPSLMQYAEQKTNSTIIESILKKDILNSCKSEYYKTLKTEIERYLPVSEHIEDVWEMVQIGSIYKVPSHPNIISLRSLKPSRTVIFDNKCFDMYFKMPIHFRCMGEVVRRSLWQKDKKLALQLNSNTWLPMFFPTKYHDKASEFRGMASHVRNKVYRLTGCKEYRSSGSWPQMGRLWAHNKIMQSIMGEVLENPTGNLEIFEIDAIRNLWHKHQSGEGDYNDILNILAGLHFSGINYRLR